MADLLTAGAAATTPPPAPKTTTGKTLWVLCVLLLIATGVVGGTSWWVFQKVHSTVSTVRDITAPAIRDVLAARDALVKADSAAINSFRSGDIKLSGPGSQYQNQLTSARDSLVQVAQLNAADKSSQQILLLEALLESYSGLIEQAHAHVGTAVGTADLWSASHLLNGGDSPILTEFNNLLDDQTTVLNDQIATSSVTTENLLNGVVPIALLFVLLAATQVFLRRQFRRAVNPSLLLATIVLVGLAIVTSLAVASQLRLENSRDTLKEVVRLWGDETSSADARRQQELSELMKKECEGANGGCGPTVEQFKPAASPTREVPNELVTKRFELFKINIKEADRYARLRFLIPLTSAIIVVLIPLGLWPRIEEYRYRPR